MAKKLILIIGLPGSGKTTDAKAIADKHPEITAYSLGELLKEESQKDTKLGKINSDYISHGDLVPTAIAIDAVCNAVQSAPTDIVLLDGFPRKEKQMKIFGDIIRDPNRVDLLSVIEVRVSEGVARERVLGRDSSREDDKEEIFNNRVKVYQETISDIEEFYQNDHLLKVIDGEREISAVIADIDAFLEKQLELAIS